jgi:hypothetical protein
MKSIYLFPAIIVMAAACLAQDTDAIVVHVGKHVLGETVQQFALIEGVRIPKLSCAGQDRERPCGNVYRINIKDGYAAFAFEDGNLRQVTYVVHDEPGQYALHHRLIDEYGKPNKMELVPSRNAFGIPMDAIHAVWLGGRVEEIQVATNTVSYPDTIVTIR